jgi:hypothetical protein
MTDERGSSPEDEQVEFDRGRDVDPGLAARRDDRGEGNMSQITAEQNAGTIERVYQTADGEERTERVPASDSSTVPSEANTPIVVDESDV